MSFRRASSGVARFVVAAGFLLLSSGACAQATGPRSIGEGRRVLFVGNSLTYVNDLPGIVQALADSGGGDKIAVHTVAGPDMALVDHWKDGTAQREIGRGGWELVVLQQGPSSVEANRDSLRLFTARFSAEMAKVNARPALYSVWPMASRRTDFARAVESYTLAASDVNGLLLPVASAWLAAWERDPSLQLYASDGLHPSLTGSYLAGLVIYGRILNRSPVGLPSRLRLRSGVTIAIDASTAALLQDVVATVLAP